MTINRKTAGRDPAALEMNIGLPTQQPHYSIFPPKQSPDFQRLKSALSLEALAERVGVMLKRSGSTLRGKCPLHDGDNPTAFAIYPDSQTWFCFRCQKGGDAIDFVQSWKGLNFREAVTWLAGEAGITLDTANLSARNNPHTDVLDAAAQFYAVQLWNADSQQARAYLFGRGLSEESMRNAGWGFSHSDTGLQDYLIQNGYDAHLAHQIGLLRQDGCDFTANANGAEASPAGYIILPHLEHGHTVYFSARAVAPLDPDDKSRNLPGERQVYWAETKDREELIIVEGQTDAESLRQLGFSALALCGVGHIPEDDLRRAVRYSRLYLALDNDVLDPNLPEAKRSEIQQRTNEAQRRLASQLGPLVMVLPDLPFKDFNAGLQTGLAAEAVKKLFGQARPWLDLLLAKAEQAGPHDLRDLIPDIVACFRRLPGNLQSVYRTRLQKALSLSRQDLNDLLQEEQNAPESGYAAVKDGRLHFMGDPLGNFTARITNELSVDDGLNPPMVRYQISGELADGSPLPSLDVPADEFSKLLWLSRHWGARPVMYMPPGKYHLAARAIQEYSLPDLVRERLFTYTGWVKVDGKHGFLSASGQLTADGLNPNVRIDLGENNLRHYILPAPSTSLEERQQGIQASLRFLNLASRRVTVPLWAAMFAAPLTSILPLNAVMWIYGPTQSGKSTLVHLALTHFGAGFVQNRDYHAPIDWTSTTAAIEGAMFTLKDAPLVIDDFAPQFTSASDARIIHQKAHYVVRSVGNRSSRGRSRADLSQQKTRFPRGLVLATAENPLVGQSIVGRVVYVNVESGDIFDENNRGAAAELSALQAQAQQGLLAQAMSLYIQELARGWEHYAAEMLAMAETSSTRLRNQHNVQNRLPDYFGVLDAAQTLALRTFRTLGLLTELDAEQTAEANREALVHLVLGQAERIQAESPVRKFFEALGSLLERKQVWLAKRKGEYLPSISGDLVGYYDVGMQHQVYLRTEVCLSYAKEFWRGLDENLDILPDALRRQLAHVDGLLFEQDPRQAEVVKWCQGSNQRVLAVDARRVEALYGVSLSPRKDDTPPEE